MPKFKRSNQCERMDDFTIAEIRAYIRKHGLNIKGRSKVDLCNQIRAAKALIPNIPRSASRSQLRKIHKKCLKTNISAQRKIIKSRKIPIRALRKDDLCKGVRTYMKKIPRIQKTSDLCPFVTRKTTKRRTSRISLGRYHSRHGTTKKKTLYDAIKSRRLNTQCYRLKDLYRIKE